MAKLDINQADDIERFVIEGPDRYERDADAEPLAFDPRAVWAALEEAFGGEKGVEQSYRAAAATLVDAFDLRSGVEVKRRRDGVVLPMRVYLDDFERKYGKNVPSPKHEGHIDLRDYTLQETAASCGAASVRNVLVSVNCAVRCERALFGSDMAGGCACGCST